MDQEQSNSYGTLLRGPSIATNNTNLVKSTSPLQSALNEQGEQLEKLATLVSQLEEKLMPVRLSRPSDESQSAQNEPVRSLVTQQVCIQVNIVRSLQHRLSCLLEELEV